MGIIPRPVSDMSSSTVSCNPRALCAIANRRERRAYGYLMMYQPTQSRTRATLASVGVIADQWHRSFAHSLVVVRPSQYCSVLSDRGGDAGRKTYLTLDGYGPAQEHVIIIGCTAVIAADELVVHPVEI